MLLIIKNFKHKNTLNIRNSQNKKKFDINFFTIFYVTNTFTKLHINELLFINKVLITLNYLQKSIAMDLYSIKKIKLLSEISTKQKYNDTGRILIQFVIKSIYDLNKFISDFFISSFE